MIRDLFSHKIHSSPDEWPEKLSELAAIFGEFDGQLFDRDAFEHRLQAISPRVSYIAHDAVSSGRDASKFRDEISAYPAYLGLYYLQKSVRGWVVRVSETARRFLLCEEPDVASFLRLQLVLFQYPNAMGARYTPFTETLNIQANARDRTLDFVRQGMHFSPIRMIVVGLLADAELRNIDPLSASISFEEIYALANSPAVNTRALPTKTNVVRVLRKIRNGELPTPTVFESRFHILRHTQFFALRNRHVVIRDGVNRADKDQLRRQLSEMAALSSEFADFDGCSRGTDLEDVIGSGSWGKYFDAVMTLSAQTVEVLGQDSAISAPTPSAIENLTAAPPLRPERYEFRDRAVEPLRIGPYSRTRELADPEVTRIKLQRRNLLHKELVDKMDAWLRSIGASPKENEHVDLFAKIPDDGSFIFEMKSGGDSLLDQIRKGLSQLYEYRYRYRAVINDEHISLCLVLPGKPISIPWVTEYLCDDREIGICWFDDAGKPVWPNNCASFMDNLRVEPAR